MHRFIFNSCTRIMKHFCIVGLIFFLTSCSSFIMHQQPKAVQGVLDLRNWDFQTSEAINLNGEWGFYWEALYETKNFEESPTPISGYIQVPSAWNGFKIDEREIGGEGYATYRLKVLLNGCPPPLALKINTISTAADIYINGQLLQSIGKVGTEKNNMQAAFAPTIISLPEVHDELDILLHVSNFFHRKGGIWDKIQVGNEKSIRQQRYKALSLEFFLVGSILIMALYHLFLFALRKKERYALYFGAFSLLVVIRVFFTGEYAVNIFADVSWSAIISMEYLSFYAGVPFFAAFFYSMFPTITPKNMVYLNCIIGGGFSLAVIVLSPELFTHTAVPYEIITLLFSLYGLFLLGIAIKKQLSGSLPFLLGFMAIFAAMLNDILFANEIINTGYYLPLGLFGFILAQTFLLSQRVSSTFNTFENINANQSEKNKKIEEQNANLKRLNDELDIFVYRTSHDLRAPIASVLGLINLAKVEDDKTKLHYYLDLQEKTLWRLENFVNDLLIYSRNTRIEVIREKIDFKNLVEDALQLHSHQGNYEKIEKIVEIDQQNTFISDPKRLSVVLNNLISNAIRYSNPYQHAPYLKISIFTDTQKALIEISDNGLGIAQKHIPKIFEMFYRGDTQSKGSGLGLFIVKDTIIKLQGEIKVVSEVNQGTTFKIILPNLKNEQNNLQLRS